MKLEYLEEYIALAGRLNFTAAAHDLHIAQSTLSKHMADLSRETGLHLIDQGRSVRLSPSGIAFLHYAERIVRLHDEALSECHRIESGFQGTLYVEDPILLSDLSNKLHDILRAFAAENPGVSTGLQANERLTTIESIDKGVFDIGQAIYCKKNLEQVQIDGRLFDLVPFMEEEVVLWVGKDHPLARKPDLRFADLAAFEVRMPGASIWSKWRTLLEGMAQRCGFTLNTTLAVSTRIDDSWSDSSSEALSLHSARVAAERRIASRTDKVVRRFDLDDTSFMFYLISDAHSKNPVVALFIDWLDTRGPLVPSAPQPPSTTRFCF